MESNNEEINKKDEKNFKLEFKPTKQVENGKKFQKLTEVLISYNIFPFLTFKEAKEIGKSDSKLYNAFIRYYKRSWDSLKTKYNIKYEGDCKPNEIYEQKDEQGHFIKLSFLNLEHYLLFSYFNWTWTNSPEYWEKITPKNSLFNKDIYRLKSVCWIDINVHMTHIYEGKYKLYLNHCVCKLKANILKMTVLLNGVPLQEFPYPSKELLEKCREAHIIKTGGENGVKMNLMRPVSRLRKGPFMRGRPGPRSIYNQDNSLKKDFIMDINVTYDEIRDNGSGHELTIKFDHTDGSWKEGWLIDGVILESEKVE
jgi:hypothetical protein